MTSQYCKGSEKRSPTKVVSFGMCKNCRGTCTNTFKLPLERLHYSQFCLSRTVVFTCKERSSDEKQQSIAHYNYQVLQHIRHTYYYYSVAKRKLHKRKVQQWKKERKKRSFSPRFARTAKWIDNNALLVAGDTTVLPPHSHHLKRNKKLRQLPIEIFFPLYCYRESQNTRDLTRKKQTSRFRL